MASSTTKRQQARNERTLQDLIRTVPGNERCADCASKNPAWSSWNLGIFLCMRCAALHRKLGTHISKVKSLSMDTWTTEQVENMRKVGNAASNKIYNPHNTLPDVPIDVDEVDAALEKHIRQKYEYRTLSGTARSSAPATRQNTGSTGTGSWNEEPASLPPKPAKKFGFNLRSSSGTISRSRQDRFTPPLSPTFHESERSGGVVSPPAKTNKPSQMFGMKITTVDNNFNAKLLQLKDMGFNDNVKNTDILKSMNGNLDRTVESLIRLGEGSKSVTKSFASAPRTHTPVSMAGSETNGITIEKQRQPQKASSNPWEVRETPGRAVSMPVTSQAFEPPRAQSVPPEKSWNPFLSQAPTSAVPAVPSIEQSFQDLNVSQTGPPSQTYPVPQGFYQGAPQQQVTNPWQSQHQQTQAQPFATSAYGQVPQSGHAATNTLNNPFMQQQSQQQLQPQQFQQLQYQQAQSQHQQSMPASNPWAQQLHPQNPQQTGNPYGTPWQQQNILLQQPATASPAPIYGQQADFFSAVQPASQPSAQPASQQFGTHNPFQQVQQPVQQQPVQQQQQQQQQHQQQYAQFAPQQQPQPQLLPQQTGRHDKSSILALYNYPQMAPQRPLQTLTEDAVVAPQAPPDFGPPQRSVTMPAQLHASSMNPFTAQQQQQPPEQSQRHVSHESVDFQGMAGRQSPDAFAGLSARYNIR